MFGERGCRMPNRAALHPTMSNEKGAFRLTKAPVWPLSTSYRKLDTTRTIAIESAVQQETVTD